ncbi:MAG TPA: hypothetical protein VN750_12510 [Steroidobacteraceae bacterium]|nr:hypothetical protein [Steroidobacteraceae bacterium]
MATIKSTRAGKAQSPPRRSRAGKAQSRLKPAAAPAGNFDWAAAGMGGSIAQMLYESPGGIEGALERLKAAKAAGRQPSVAIAVGEESPAANEPQCHPMDRTDNRIRAYLASVQSLSGIASQEIDVGRELIERMAFTAKGDQYPELRLTPNECADVLHYLADRKPVEPGAWWNDPPKGSPSHVCGFYLILEILARSLRTANQQRSEAEASLAKICGTSDIPQLILDHLKEQQRRANELLSLLEQFDERDDAPIWVRIAVRTAAGLTEALDDLTLGRVLKAEEASS